MINKMTHSGSQKVSPDPQPGEFLNIMPIEDVMELESSDVRWSGDTLWDVLEEKMRDYWFKDLKARIETDGFMAGRAVCIQDWDGYETICDGHHRLAVLIELGAYWCPVQDTPTYRYRWNE